MIDGMQSFHPFVRKSISSHAMQYVLQSNGYVKRFPGITRADGSMAHRYVQCDNSTAI